MKITSLSLFNLRSFEFAEATFNPHFNLIAGINGAGKSTVLDAIRTCASHILPAMMRVPSKPFSFGVDDIHNDAPFADATLHFTLNNEPCRFTLREWREPLAVDNPENLEKLRREILDAERLNDRPRRLIRDLAETLDTPSPTVFNPSESQLKGLYALESSAPLVVYFSTARTQLNAQKQNISADGTGAAYVRALNGAELSVVQFAEWFRVQQTLADEWPASKQLVEAIDAAVRRFLPSFSNLRPSDVGPSQLLIDHEGTTLHLRQLSDGERSVLVMVLDIARRLTQANPHLVKPLIEAEAIILIDEIDLHLHPQWQRKIVGDLTRTFPNCQFIASTHSPQIIGETQPDQLILFRREDGRIVPQQCGQAYGLDTNYVLEHIMETPSRPAPVLAAIDAVEEALDEADLDRAREKLADLRRLQHGDDPTSAGLEAAINNLEAFADEDD